MLASPALALIVAVGVAIADSTPSVTITSTKHGQSISRSRNQHLAAAGKSSFATPRQSVTEFYLPLDGHDTNDNSADFTVATAPTPRATNGA